MTVIELIEKLAEYPPDMPILFYDDEVGELYPAVWVGEMEGWLDGKTDECISGVAIHHFQPSSKDEWIARA